MTAALIVVGVLVVSFGIAALFEVAERAGAGEETGGNAHMPGKTIDLLVNGAQGSRRRGPGGCALCGQKVFWCVTATGGSVPFDVHPDPIRVAGDVETVSRAHLHFETCPRRGDRAAQRPLPEAPPDRRFGDD